MSRENLPLVVHLAQEILAMHDELTRLRIEVDELSGYERKYMDSLQDGINHSTGIIGTILGAAMDPESRLSRMLALEAMDLERSPTKSEAE